MGIPDKTDVGHVVVSTSIDGNLDKLGRYSNTSIGQSIAENLFTRLVFCLLCLVLCFLFIGDKFLSMCFFLLT